jgi:hypothetical protein
MLSKLSFLLVVSLAVFGSVTSAVMGNETLTIPFDYPLFKQCDDRWGSDIMGTKTICSVGCLMSSTAMGLWGTRIPISKLPFIPTNPGTFNTWLVENDGYSGNNLIETQVPLIDPSRIFWPDDGMHKTNDLSFDEVSAYLEKGRIVIGNVNEGGHFVLLTGYSNDDKDTFAVNDPGYNRTTYSYKSDIVGYRIFDMIRK